MSEEIKFETVEEAIRAAFKQAVRGLDSQGWQRCEAHGNCQWNAGRPNFHCAVGWLIPEDNQTEERTGGVSDLVEMKELEADSVLYPEYHEWLRNEKFSNFLYFLQDAHDAGQASDMKERFVLLENQYGLEWPDDVSPIIEID